MTEEEIIELVKLELIEDLISEKFRDSKIKHPMFGHCHHSSLTLYNLLGGKEQGYKLEKAIDELDIIHYWLSTKDGRIIDVTSSQYTDLNRPLPYKSKINKGVSYLKSNEFFSLTINASQTLECLKFNPILNSEDFVWKKDLEIKKLFSCKVAKLPEKGLKSKANDGWWTKLSYL